MRLDDGRVIPNFLQQALKDKSLTIYGDGKQTRSFCYVDDLIDGITKLLFSKEHLPINIGNPDEITITDLANAVNEIVGNKSELSYLKGKVAGDDPMQRRPDITKANELLELVA